MTQDRNHLVIMAGGVGSRFWPMSTEDNPKQFIDILGVGRTLLQLTYDRFKGICPLENVWVVTNKKYAALVREQLPEVPAENILLEPCRRNTAPCIAYVTWRIKAINPKANVVITPSDHFVTDVEEFRRVITSSMKLQPRPTPSSLSACRRHVPRLATATFRLTSLQRRHATARYIASTRSARSPTWRPQRNTYRIRTISGMQASSYGASLQS